jgi:murein DD-endopeptidase MepM/ murein hydrolase activator NlpD
MAPRVKTRIAMLGAVVLVVGVPSALAVPGGPPIVVGLETEEERETSTPGPDGKLAIPKVDGEPVDKKYPVLANQWVHPVTDSSEVIPLRWQRKYGAPRYPGGGRRCGRGHCGVDLEGPRGRPIVAVLGGTVLNVERRRNGKDGKSGRYVRIEHDGGVTTAYMHLDSIAPGLSKGDTVDAGDVIGALGRSGIRSGDAHLHFGLEIPSDRPSPRGKKKNTRHVDPTPFLERARVVPDPAKRTKSDRAKRAQS